MPRKKPEPLLITKEALNKYRNNLKYARVITGFETCVFCFMLSSRGFVYRSEETASHGYHANCDCVVVPGVEGRTKIDGYDPQGMYDRWISGSYR